MLSGHCFLKHILLLIYASFLHLKKQNKKRSESRSVLWEREVVSLSSWCLCKVLIEQIITSPAFSILWGTHEHRLNGNQMLLNTNKPWHHNPQLSTRYPRPVFRRSLMAVSVLYKTLIRRFNWFGRCCWLAEPGRLVSAQWQGVVQL